MLHSESIFVFLRIRKRTGTC